jgi:chemotaxis protein CheD
MSATATTPEIMVRMGELATAGRGGANLVSIGLGSCIGLALLDRSKRAAGLAHVMLPAAPPEGHGGSPGKFADHAVGALLAELASLGVRRQGLEAVLVGGARMFSVGSSMDIGARNEEGVRAALRTAGIPVRAAETRGSTGRTIRVLTSEAVVTVKAAGAQPITLFGA